MSTLMKGAAAIRRAEEQLRGLLAEAAESARYEEIVVLAEWAKQLQDLLASSGVSDGCGCPVELVDGVNHRKSAAAPGPNTAGTTGVSPKGTVNSSPKTARGSSRKRRSQPQRSKAQSKTRKQSTAKLVEYPQFVREGDHLVKIAWSKSEKAPYEHKAPKQVLDLLLKTLAVAGEAGRRFTTEDVLPLQDQSDGAEVPSYQAYLCLAWLRSVNLIEQHGRQGYSLPQPQELTRGAADSWEQLARR